MASSVALVDEDIDISNGDHKTEYDAMAQTSSSESAASEDDVLRFGWRYTLLEGRIFQSVVCDSVMLFTRAWIYVCRLQSLLENGFAFLVLAQDVGTANFCARGHHSRHHQHKSRYECLKCDLGHACTTTGEQQRFE